MQVNSCSFAYNLLARVIFLLCDEEFVVFVSKG